MTTSSNEVRIPMPEDLLRFYRNMEENYTISRICRMRTEKSEFDFKASLSVFWGVAHQSVVDIYDKHVTIDHDTLELVVRDSSDTENEGYSSELFDY